MAAMLDFSREAQFWRTALVSDILPWWLRHALDHAHGGLFSCIGDDGIVQSTDKYIWSQVRAVWTFAAAYNRIDANAAYLDAARSIFGFAAEHGRNDEGDWLFLVDRHGKMKEGPESIQCDAFALCALVEHYIATADPQALEIAWQTFHRTRDKLSRPGSYRTKPYPIPTGAKAQRVSMQFSLAYSDFYRITQDATVREAAIDLMDDVLEHFYRPDLEAAVEYLAADNTLLPPPIGTYIGPGHGIETAWFQLDNMRNLNASTPQRTARACEIMRWSFTRGWDETYGGLYLGVDAHGGEPYLSNSDTKIWWPHAEAICGALIACEACGEPWTLDWYKRTRDWSLAHFPHPEYGEWRQRLDRQGRPITKVVALPVKDPFHLPRAMIYAVESLERLAERETQAR